MTQVCFDEEILRFRRLDPAAEAQNDRGCQLRTKRAPCGKRWLEETAYATVFHSLKADDTIHTQAYKPLIPFSLFLSFGSTPWYLIQYNS